MLEFKFTATNWPDLLEQIQEVLGEDRVSLTAKGHAATEKDPEVELDVTEVELDADGIAWHPKYHASTRTKTKDGRWTKRRGGPELPPVAATLQELTGFGVELAGTGIPWQGPGSILEVAAKLDPKYANWNNITQADAGVLLAHLRASFPDVAQ